MQQHTTIRVRCMMLKKEKKERKKRKKERKMINCAMKYARSLNINRILTKIK